MGRSTPMQKVAKLDIEDLPQRDDDLELRAIV